MARSEFEIIRRYFTPRGSDRGDVVAGVGDDAALLRVPPEMELAVCTDTLVAGIHFPEGTVPAAIGHKALAVNLSDLAAMGAEPAWAILSLTLSSGDDEWLEAFSAAFLHLAERYHVQLIGGDITRGPLSITVGAHGFVPAGQALRRRGACPGDRIYVTGTLGDAGLALRLGSAADAALRRRLEYPQPRVAAGMALRDLASAAIDISDGLLADLAHLLEADDLGAVLHLDALPRSDDFLLAVKRLDPEQTGLYHDLPLSAGDDYELCFTVPEEQCRETEQRLAAAGCSCRAVGEIVAQPGVRCYREKDEPYQPAGTGYRHFST